MIRTQPTEGALSTVEAAAIALATLERDRGVYALLIEPLKLICAYQVSQTAGPPLRPPSPAPLTPSRLRRSATGP